MEHQDRHHGISKARNAEFVTPESDSDDDEIVFIAQSASAARYNSMSTSSEFLLHRPASSFLPGHSGATDAIGSVGETIGIPETRQLATCTGFDTVEALTDTLSNMELSKQPERLLLHPASSPPPGLVQRSPPSSPPQLLVSEVLPVSTEETCAQSVSGQQLSERNSLASMVSLAFARQIVNQDNGND